VEEAQRAVDDYRNKVQAELNQAERAYHVADDAFNQAKRDANSALASAQGKVDAAQRRYCHSMSQLGDVAFNSMDGDGKMVSTCCLWRLENGSAG
jgi:hypothetical protein